MSMSSTRTGRSKKIVEVQEIRDNSLRVAGLKKGAGGGGRMKNLSDGMLSSRRKQVRTHVEN